MKKRAVEKAFIFYFLSIILVTLFSQPVAAQQSNIFDVPIGRSGLFAAINNLFGGESDATWGQFIVTFLIFILFFVSFSDIVANFSAFSKGVSWVIGLIIALIGSFSGLIILISTWALGITAGLGVVSVFVSIGMTFVAFLLLHLGIGGVQKWVIQRQIGIKAARGVEEAGIGVKVAKRMGKEAYKS